MSDISTQWLIVFVDASVKAGLVALLVAAGLSLLRVRNSNVRHRVWAGVLCGMLLLPALTQIVPALRLPFAIDPAWFAVLSSSETDEEPGPAVDQATNPEEQPVVAQDQTPQAAPVDTEPMLMGDDRGMMRRPGWPGAPGNWPEQSFGAAPQSPTLPTDAPGGASQVAVGPPVVDAPREKSDAGNIGHGSSRAVAPSVARIMLARLPLVFWTVWIGGGLILMLRLAVGLWTARVLKCASQPIDVEKLSEAGWETPGVNSSRRPVPILECPRIRVPLTLGAIRPRILLPPDWIDWSVEKLRAVLVHERTHAERGDCALALLAELNRCLYWFHPLAWWLRRRLAMLAEAACDDAAIGTTGDRAGYARHLLEVAATARAHRGRLVAGGVSMARVSGVETRINSILDFTRPLSQRLTRGTAAVLVGIIVPLIALAAALRPADRETAMDVSATTADNSPSETAPASSDPTDADRRVSNPTAELSTQSAAPGTTESVPSPNVTYTFAGTVVDEQGQPVKGAEISLNYFSKHPRPVKPATAAITDAQGKFEFSSNSRKFADAFANAFWSYAGLVAVKEGTGFAFAPAAFFETTGQMDRELTEWEREQIEQRAGGKTSVLTLVRDDVPIRGRVLNAEGGPVAGASIEAVNVWEGKDGTLDAWETAAKQQDSNFPGSMRHVRKLVEGNRMSFLGRGEMTSSAGRVELSQGNLFTGIRPPLIPAVRTDADGWFTLQGTGRDRILEIRVSGPGIETTEELVRSRAGEVLTLPLSRQVSQAMVRAFYPSEFTFVSGPGRSVTGRVTDVKTGKPLAGIGVQAMSISTGTITDTDGRYRLDGLAVGNNEIFLVPPPGSRYLAGSVSLTTTAASNDVVRDAVLTAGVLIRGRAIDETTGKPAQGHLEYFAYATNSHVRESDSLRQRGVRPVFATDADGRFEIAVLPGRGILGFSAGANFPQGVGTERIDCPRMEGNGAEVVFNTAPRRCVASAENLLVPLDPQPGDTELALDLTLRSIAPIAGTVLGPDGQPLEGYSFTGDRRGIHSNHQRFTIEGYLPSAPRRLTVYHAEKNLAGYYDLKGEPPAQVEITLRPAATLIGRVVDSDGDPLEHAGIQGIHSRPEGVNPSRSVGGEFVEADAQGRFEIRGIVPGLKYAARVWVPRNGNKALPVLVSLFTDAVAEKPETKDLGDLRPTADQRDPTLSLDPTMNGGKKNTAAADAVTKAAPASPAETAAAGANGGESRAARSRTVRGRVVDDQGRPIAGVALQVPAIAQNRISQGDDDSPHLAQNKTDADGRFVLEVEDDRRLPLIAAHPGFAVELFDIPQQGDVPAAEIVLHPEQPIHGRMIDSEGRPVAGAKVFIGRRLTTRQANSLDEYLEERKKPPRGQPVETRFMSIGFMPKSYLATSDAEGRFVIRGIAADGACVVTITADRFVRGALVVVNRQGLDPAPYNQPAGAFGRAPDRLVGPDFTHVGAPGMTIEGRATAAGKPVANVIVRAAANVAVAGVTTTDAEGRYRLEGLPRGGEFRLVFGGPERQSDFLPHEVTVATTPDDALKTVDVELKLGSVTAGTVLSGRVIDPLTGKGVPAFVRFVPLAGNEFANQPRYKDMKRGMRNVRANAAGEFRIPVMPGPGALLVQVNPTILVGKQMFSPFRRTVVSNDDRVKLKVAEVGGMRGAIPVATGGFTDLYHTARYINLAEGAQAEPVEITLDRGKTTELEIVDADGQPVTGALFSGIDDHPVPTRLDESRTTIYALDAEAPRRVVALHAGRGLAAALTLTGDEPSPVALKLTKAASIRGRAVEKSGEPIADTRCDVYLPAANRIYEAENTGKPQPTTDKDGRFQFANMIPGERFELRIILDGKLLIAKLTDEQQLLKPGQDIDLGDVVFAPRNQQLPRQNLPVGPATGADTARPVGDKVARQNATGESPPAAKAGSSAEDSQFTFAGTVVDELGRPVVGAAISLSYFSRNPHPAAAARAAVSDDQGKFEFALRSSDVPDAVADGFWIDAGVLATKEGYGFALAPAAYLETTGEQYVGLTDRDRALIEMRTGKRTRNLVLVRDDVPIRGRILNSEGQPVVGARIDTVDVWEGKEGTLDTWHAATREERADFHSAGRTLREMARGHRMLFGSHVAPLSLIEKRLYLGNLFTGVRRPMIGSVRTGADGRFTIKGMGRERIAEILVSAPGIETAEILVRSRPGAELWLPENTQDLRNPRMAMRVYYPSEFAFVAGPSAPVTGRITDAKTGQALGGIGVQATSQSTGTITGPDGTYRLEGLPLGNSELLIVPPDGSRYLVGAVSVATAAIAGPAVRDVTLTAGVLVRGRAIGEITGRPVRGQLEYFAYANNPHVRESDSLHQRTFQPVFATDAEGRFEIPVLPGQGILAFNTESSAPRGVGADQIDCPRYGRGGNGIAFQTVPRVCQTGTHSLVLPLNPKADDRELTVNLTLSAGTNVAGTVHSPDGQPLHDYLIHGLRKAAPWKLNAGEGFTVVNHFPTEPRRLFVYHAATGLAGSYELIGKPPEKLVVTLARAATIVGRALDEQGTPLAGVMIYDDLSLGQSPNAAPPSRESGVLPTAANGNFHLTDSQGRFAIKGIIPGLKYTAHVRGPKQIGDGIVTLPLGAIFQDIIVGSGETKDVGDVRVQSDESGSGNLRAPVSPKTTEKASAATSAEDSVQSAQSPAAGKNASPAEQKPATKAGSAADDTQFTYAGTVIGPDGKPVAGARLHLCYYTRDPSPDLRSLATTGADGTFRFSRKKSDFDKLGDSVGPWQTASLVATADGRGFAIKNSAIFETTGALRAALAGAPKEFLEELSSQTNVLKLVPDDEPVRARIVDVEGQPVIGARLSVLEVWQGTDGTLANWKQEVSRAGANAEQPSNELSLLINGPRTAVAASASAPDRDGWLVVTGLGKERIAKVQLSGPGIESAIFHIRTRRGETIRLSRASDRSLGEEIYYPAEFTHAAGPSQPIVGTISDAKSGAPLAGCVVQADLTTPTDGNSQFMVGTLGATTDAQGRYRLEGLRPGEHILTVLPPRGTALLPRGFIATTEAKPAAITHDVQLHTGVRIRGTILDSRTGKPIAASLRYEPFSNNPAARPDREQILVGLDPYYYSTDSQGRFELPAVPGNGVLTVMAHNPQAYPIGTGLEAAQAAATAAGARSEFSGYANLVHAVNLAPGSEINKVDLTLGSGRTVSGSVETPDGERLGDYLIYGQSQYPFWGENKGEAFEVQAYAPNEKRRLMFYHPRRNLVGVYELSGEPPESLKIVLEPGGVIKGRIVDRAGLPQEGIQIINAGAEMASPVAMRPVDHPLAGVLSDRFDKVSVLRTAADGRFEIRGIIRGLKYSATAFGRVDDRPAFLGSVFSDATGKPGEVIDLGDVVPGKSATRPAVKPAGAAEPNALEKAAAAGTESSGPSPQLPASGKAETKPSATVSVTGVVLKPDGKPAAGATVRAAVALWAMLKPIVGDDFQSPMSEQKTDAQGRFTISFPTQPFGDLSRLDEHWKEIWKKTTIAASLDRFGPAWVAYDEIEQGKPVTLRLVEDVPVRGRVVDLEGRPVAGAVVRLDDLHGAAGDDLSAWIDGIKAGELPWTVISKASRHLELRLIGLPDKLTTAADGTIALRGLGRERYLQLTIEGEQVAYRHATLVTRKMDPIRQTISARPFEATEPVFGAEFTFTADPARTIEGVVRDAKSGEALAAVSVESYKLVGYPYSNNRVLKTKTDKLGRFRLTGMPKGSGNQLLLVPNDGQPYFMREVDVPDPVGLGPAKMEIELHRGIWITGRVTDQVTGQPVPVVKMYYLPWLSNEYAQKTPEFDAGGHVHGDQWRYVTKPDGTYRLVGLPGRAIVGADSVLQSFRQGVGFESITGTKTDAGEFDTYRNPINPGRSWPTMMREINPAADATEISLDFALDPGRTVKIRVVDGDGAPVVGVTGTGLTTQSGTKPSQQAVLVAQNLRSDETRKIVLKHKGRQIGRVTTIGPEQIAAGEIVVELQPLTKVTGLLRDAEGGPISGMDVEPRLLPSGDFIEQLSATASGADGRFETVLIPGCHYSFAGRGGGFQFVSIVDDLAIEPGVTRDLGTLVIGTDGKVIRQEPRREGGSAPEKGGAPKTSEKPGAAASTESSVLSTQSGSSGGAASKPGGNATFNVVHGRVTGPDGKPAAKASIAVIGMKLQADRGGDLSPHIVTLSEGAAGENGAFQLKLVGISAKTHSYVSVIARADRSGLAWQRVDPDARDTEASLELPAEEVIRGRFIDIEGRPAGGIRMSIGSVTPRGKERQRDGGIGVREFSGLPKAWPPSVTADSEGHFILRGVPSDQGVSLVVDGNDRFAPQWLSINTGQPEQRPDNDGTYRSLVRNFKVGEEWVLPLAPAQVFEGVVRYADTNEPAPHARLTIWSSQQERPGSWVGLPGKADAQGRYRINPQPGVRFSIIAYPPNGAPYLIRRVSDLTHKAGAPVKIVDVALPRGVLVRGRIVEVGTQAAVAGASIQYVPTREASAKASPDVLTGWEGIVISDDKGAFGITVLPGKGTLLAHGPQGWYVLKEIGSRRLDGWLPGGDRNYAHVIQPINPEPNAEPLELTLELQRGATVAGRITDATGKQVEHALMITRLHIHPTSLHWRGFPLDAMGGRFELTGLAEGVEYPVQFLDPKNRLGATLMIKAGMEPPTVVLEPCTDAVGTFVDGTGKPVLGQPLQFVATPGPHRFAAMAEALGALTADTDFYSNIDNSHPAPKLDAEGRTTYTGLIPGARYQILDWVNGRAIVVKEFVAESQKTLDLGKITMSTRKEE